MGAALRSAPTENGPPAVSGERHELGLLMLGTLLRADGWQVAFLGADTPLADGVELAEDLGTTMLCLSARSVRELRRLAR